jgi:hypothetical protein
LHLPDDVIMVQTYADLINNITSLRTDFSAKLQETVTKYPKIRKEKDSRVTFLSKSIVVIDSVTMCCIFADRHLSNNKWWTTSAQLYDLNPPPVESRKPMKEGFKQFILLGCFHFLFSAMESSIRVISNAVDQIQYKRMQSSFESIYSWLIQRLKLGKKYAKLMDVLRLIRNTIHNNGVYSPVPKKGKRPRNRQMSWRGIKCEFPVNRNVKVDDFWKLVFTTIPDCLSMMLQIIDSKAVSKISHIEDLSVEKSLIPIFFPGVK